MDVHPAMTCRQPECSEDLELRGDHTCASRQILPGDETSGIDQCSGGRRSRASEKTV